jgi:hypothetical protein
MKIGGSAILQPAKPGRRTFKSNWEAILIAVAESAVDGRAPRSLMLACARGYLCGLSLAALATAFEMLYRGRSFREVPLVGYLVYWPPACVAISCLRWPGAARFPDRFNRTATRMPDLQRGRFGVAGFTMGLVYGLVATALQLLPGCWWILPQTLVFNMLLFSLTGFVVGCRVGRVPGERRWSWRFVRFRMRSMMLLIAYLAVLLGLGIVTARIGLRAQRYLQQYVQAREMASALGGQLTKSQAEVLVRFRNAGRLREGAIPTDIMKSQQAFLKSLDTDLKVKPEYRKYRYNLIADGEDYLGRQAETAVKSLTASVNYFSQLAAKYEKAMHKPWLPVEPDPPRP